MRWRYADCALTVEVAAGRSIVRWVGSRGEVEEAPMEPARGAQAPPPLMVRVEAGRLSASDLEHPDLQPLLLPLDKFDGQGSRLPGAVIKNPGGGKQKHWATCWVINRRAKYVSASGEVRRRSPAPPPSISCCLPPSPLTTRSPPPDHHYSPPHHRSPLQRSLLHTLANQAGKRSRGVTSRCLR